MTTKKSHKSRQQQTKTATVKTAKSKSVPVAESAVGDASSSVTTALTQSPLPASDLKDIIKPVAEQMMQNTGDQPVIVMPPPKAAKPYWHREPDSPTRKLFDKIVVHRTAGRPDADIAKLLKTTEANVRQTVWIAKKNGWLTDDGDVVDIEAELALDIDRKVVRNIGHVLDGGMVNHQTQEMTIAAAKGRGIFKNHEKTEGGINANVLAPVQINVIMPTIGESDQKVIEENVGGTEMFVEGEVVDGAEQQLAGTIRADENQTDQGTAQHESGTVRGAGQVDT